MDNKKLNKGFDNLIDSDQKGNFLLQYSALCFDQCVPKITEQDLSQTERACISDCYAKAYYSFNKTNDII
jgi:hypothetical protein